MPTKSKNIKLKKYINKKNISRLAKHNNIKKKYKTKKTTFRLSKHNKVKKYMKGGSTFYNKIEKAIRSRIIDNNNIKEIPFKQRKRIENIYKSNHNNEYLFDYIIPSKEGSKQSLFYHGKGDNIHPITAGIKGEHYYFTVLERPSSKSFIIFVLGKVVNNGNQNNSNQNNDNVIIPNNSVKMNSKHN